MKIKFRTWDKELKKFQSINVWNFSRYSPENHHREIVLDESVAAVMGSDDRFIMNLFTGLVDKNGKEIFEGDILSCPWNHCPKHTSVGYVVFWEGSFRLARKEETDEILKRYCPWDTYGFNDTPTRTFFWKDATIIGNIYENPELLKQ